MGMIPIQPSLLLTFSLITLTASQCPDVLPSITDKIINGNPATPSYHIALASPPTPAVRRCTATRISQRWALTAAHCLVNTSWTAQIQASNITNGIIIPILQVFSHPNYNQPTDRRFDIAVLNLDAPEVDENNLVVLNSDAGKPQPGAFVRVAGYGASATTAPAPHGQLAHVDIPIVPFQKCRQLYEGTPNLGLLQGDKQLCAGYLKGGCDACSGDSGGPIVQFDTTGRAVQVGIISASRGCALANFPGIAVRIDAYLPWLSELGVMFRTGVGVQVFRRGSVSIEPVDGEPIPEGTPSEVKDSPSPSVTPTPRPSTGREPRDEGEGVDKPIGPRPPPSIAPTPQPEEVLDDGDNEVPKPSAEVDEQKGEALAGDIAVGGEIVGGGVNGGVVAGGVIGGIVLIAVVVVGALFFVKNRTSVAGNHMPRIEAG